MSLFVHLRGWLMEVYYITYYTCPNFLIKNNTSKTRK